MDLFRKLLVSQHRLKLNVVERPSALLYLLGLLMSLFLGVCFIFFAIFRKLTEALLYLYYGNKFHGLLTNSDALYAVQEKEWPTIVMGLSFVKSKEKTDVLKRFRDRYRSRIFEQPENYPKVTTTYHKFLGYVYLLQEKLNIEEHIKPMPIPENHEEFITEDELKTVMEKYGNAPLPRNDTTLWEVFVAEKPLKTNDTKDGYTYVVVSKTHHMVGDGPSMFAMLVKLWTDDESTTKTFLMDKIKQNANVKEVTQWQKMSKAFVSVLKQIIFVLNVIYVSGGLSFYHYFLRKMDNHRLHGPKLTGEKRVGWLKEERTELIPIIKNIKNTVPKCTFSDVVYTAVGASLIDYFKRNSIDTPPHISIGFSLITSFRDLGKPGPAVLENNISCGLLWFPEKGALLEKLEAVAEQYSYSKKHPDAQVNQFFMNTYCKPFPLPFLAPFTAPPGLTAIVTNLPGGPSMTMMGGLEFDGIVTYLPNRGKTGISIGILTYDNRVYFGIFVDKAIISSREEVQKIADGFGENIRKLQEEVKRKYQ